MAFFPPKIPHVLFRGGNVLQMDEIDVEAKATNWFRARGIKPTLDEYRKVCSSIRRGGKPMGIC